MDSDLRQVIELLHATPARAAISTTGAGAQVLGWLLAVAGASNTVLEGMVPYAYASLDELLRRVDADTKGGACNAETSNLMAKSSLERAHQIAQAEKARGQDTAGWVLLGVGCTAAIVSVVPKKGASTAYTLRLSKGKRDRFGEDSMVSRLLLLALCEGAGVPGARELIFPQGMLVDGEAISTSPE